MKPLQSHKKELIEELTRTARKGLPGATEDLARLAASLFEAGIGMVGQKRDDSVALTVFSSAGDLEPEILVDPRDLPLFDHLAHDGQMTATGSDEALDWPFARRCKARCLAAVAVPTDPPCFVAVMDSRNLVLDDSDLNWLVEAAGMLALAASQDTLATLESPPSYQDALARLTEALTFGLDVETLLDRALSALLSMRFIWLQNAASIFLLDREKNRLLLSAHQGPEEVLDHCKKSLEPGQCLCGHALVEGRILFRASAAAEPWHSDAACGLYSHGDLCVPLPGVDGEPIGVLHVPTRENSAVPDEFLRIIGAFGRRLGRAVDSALRISALCDHNADLKDLVVIQEQQVRDLYVALEHAKKAKTDFLASMSHELRTPLNAIIGFSQVLAEEYFGPLNEKQKQYVSDILDSGKHLLALINDILDLARVDAGMMEADFGKICVASLLESSLNMVKEKAFKHGIDLSTDITNEVRDTLIEADERKVKQIVFNLLSNATKFTPDSGAITVAARLCTQPDEVCEQPTDNPFAGRYVEVSVSDTGVGIEGEDKERVFEDFYQVKGGPSGKTPGTGLGLPLTRRLVEMHGGRIWVESEGSGQGSRFVFRLPVRQPDQDRTTDD